MEKQGKQVNALLDLFKVTFRHSNGESITQMRAAPSLKVLLDFMEVDFAEMPEIVSIVTKGKVLASVPY